MARPEEAAREESSMSCGRTREASIRSGARQRRGQEREGERERGIACGAHLSRREEAPIGQALQERRELPPAEDSGHLVQPLAVAHLAKLLAPRKQRRERTVKVGLRRRAHAHVQPRALTPRRDRQRGSHWRHTHREQPRRSALQHRTRQRPHRLRLGGSWAAARGWKGEERWSRGEVTRGDSDLNVPERHVYDGRAHACYNVPVPVNVR